MRKREKKRHAQRMMKKGERNDSACPNIEKERREMRSCKKEFQQIRW
jgi:hypothetical protein